MLLDEQITRYIDDLRPLIKRDVTKFLVFPEFAGTATKIKYDSMGRRSVYWKDFNDWNEYRYIDNVLENTLAQSGYPVVQSVTLPLLKDCELLGVILHKTKKFLSYSVSHTKYQDLSQVDSLFLLPDHALSILPYMIPTNFKGLKPSDAKSRIVEIYTQLESVLQQRRAPLIFPGNKSRSINKLVSYYPRIEESEVKSLLFLQDRREL